MQKETREAKIEEDNAGEKRPLRKVGKKVRGKTGDAQAKQTI